MVSLNDHARCTRCGQYATTGSPTGLCLADGGVLVRSATLLTRVQNALTSPGWTDLGSMPFGLYLSESDIIYADDGYYYVLNTEGDGNPYNYFVSLTITGWNLISAIGTLVVTANHRLPASLRIVSTIAGVNGQANGARVISANPNVMTLTSSGASASGTFTFAFNGATTGSITTGALTAASLQTTLQALAGIGAGNATVWGTTWDANGNGTFYIQLATGLSTQNLTKTGNGGASGAISLLPAFALNIYPTTSFTPASGSGGTITVAGNSAQCALRRATTPAGLVTAVAGTNWIGRVASSLYYPTLVYVPGGSPNWYAFGYNVAGICQRKSFTGAYPNTQDAFGSAATVSTLPLIDLHIRKHPTTGDYYAVGENIPASAVFDYTHIEVYTCTAANIGANSWSIVGAMGTVWDDFPGGLAPAWCRYAVADARLAFQGGKVWMFFAGRAADAFPHHLGVVELDGTSYKAKVGTDVQLVVGPNYPTFTGGVIPSCAVYVDCPDGVARLFVTTNTLANPLPYDGGGSGVLGCLELP